MSYDPVSIHKTTADENGSSNAIITGTTNSTGVLIHKVAMVSATGGSAVMSVIINDDQAVGTTNQIISLSSSGGSTFAEDEFQRYVSESYNPPVPVQRGVSINVTGIAHTVWIYYTRQ